MTAPMPPFAINKGLYVQGIAVDTLQLLMAQSNSPLGRDDVKLMMWNHGIRQTIAGPNKVLLNVPKTPALSPFFKWVGPVYVNRYVIIGRNDCKVVSSMDELNQYKVSTVRDSLPEKALIDCGIKESTITSSVTHVIPLKNLDSRKVDYFAYADTSARYIMQSMGKDLDDYTFGHTYQEVPLYFAFSRDTSDDFIQTLNENLARMKQPGSDGMSRFDKIVAKYMPLGLPK